MHLYPAARYGRLTLIVLLYFPNLLRKKSERERERERRGERQRETEAVTDRDSQTDTGR